MKRNLIFLTLGLAILMLACNLTPSATAQATPSAPPAATVAPPEATAVPPTEAVPTPTSPQPAPEVNQTPILVPGPAIAFAGVRFTFRPRSPAA